LVDDTRVVLSDEPVNYRWLSGVGLVGVEQRPLTVPSVADMFD
jgi:hypothetical protein